MLSGLRFLAALTRERCGSPEMTVSYELIKDILIILLTYYHEEFHSLYYAMRYLSSIVPLDGTKDGCPMRFAGKLSGVGLFKDLVVKSGGCGVGFCL
jgi:hypothetical protein